MKDDSLSINTLASNTCLCHRNVFKNGVKKRKFIFYVQKKLKIWFILYHTWIFFSNFTSMWSTYLSNNIWRDRKINFCGKFAIKTLSCYRCWHWKSKVSPYVLWTTCWRNLNHNRMVRNVPNLEVLTKNGAFKIETSQFQNHFRQALTPFCKTFL